MIHLAILAVALPGYSVTAPLRADIDGACASAAQAPAATAARVAYAGQRPSPWMRSSLAQDERAQRDARFQRGDFANVRSRNGVLVATIAHIDATGDGSITYEYCFRRDRLVREQTTIASATDEMVWTRRTYFERTHVLARTAFSRDLSGASLTRPRAAPHIEAPLYWAPSNLPFWTVLRT